MIGMKVGLDDFIVGEGTRWQDSFQRLERLKLDDSRLHELAAWWQQWSCKQDRTTNFKTEYSAPISIDTPVLPDMPSGIFPPWIEDMIDSVARATETPRELGAFLGLGVVGACCQKTFVVCPAAGYFEPVNIWTVVAMESGNRKTAVMQAMTGPLLDWESEQQEAAAKEIARIESERATSIARVKHLRGKAAQSSMEDSEDFEDVQEEIAKLEASIQEVPVYPRLWSQDITPEKLGQVMAENGECLAILSDEGGLFDILAGRYNGGIPNLDLFLQAHAGMAVRVDRGSRPPVFMQHPALTMALCPQPEILRVLIQKSGFRGRGLLARFLYGLPPSPLGYRTLDSNPIAESVTTEYRNKIFALLRLGPIKNEKGEIKSRVISFTTDAYQEWKEFARVVEHDMRDGRRFEHFRDWAGKLPGAAARIAGLLHCAEHAGTQQWPAEINKNTMAKALQLAAVLSHHAEAAFDLMGSDIDLADARKVWRWVERHRRRRFSARDCFQALRRTFPRMSELEPAFGVLLERFYLFELDQASNRGRPSRVFTANPAFTEGWQ